MFIYFLIFFFFEETRCFKI